MLQVFKTRPYLVPKVWGGQKLATVFGRELADDQPYGESWEVADIPEGHCEVATGAFAGRSLADVVDELGEDLVGTASPDGRFPLLVKILDAGHDLSVQVHPGPEHLGSKPGARSKDECWLILDADSDAAIVHGLLRHETADIFRAAANAGTLADLLHRIPVRAGDIFRVPPGTIHAICAGTALLEIQQPSDTTYRVYDYDRPGLDGMPRALHLNEAIDVAILGPTLPEERGLGLSTGLIAPGVRVLANVDAYRIEKFVPPGDTSWPISAHTPQVVHLLKGHCRLDDVLLGPSDTAIIPAALGRVWLTQPDNCEIIVAGLGGPPLIAA